jgi:phosphatidylglycerophosphate synthase
MQGVIAIPAGSEKLLRENVAGVPLLARVVQTAMRAGVEELLLFWPADMDQGIWQEFVSGSRLETVRIDLMPFDPRESSSWAAAASFLKDEFVWLPWNFVTTRHALAAVETSLSLPRNWCVPVRLSKDLLLRNPLPALRKDPRVEGVSVQSRGDIRLAERFLVANSGKATDGVYSKFNRKLSRPFVRALTHTSITPNTVTLAGLLVAIFSAFVYSRGFYSAYVGGAILFFISGLIDEMDGMLARIKFLESTFGTWFEGFVDNATYLLLFAGITAGLYRQRGKAELLWGVALVAGCMLSILVVAIQRKAVTAPNRPHEYSARMNRVMEADSTLVSRIARQIHIFIKKGVAVHYVLIFTVLGLLPFFLRLAAISANLTWMIVCYLMWRITRTHSPAVNELRPAA